MSANSNVVNPKWLLLLLLLISVQGDDADSVANYIDDKYIDFVDQQEHRSAYRWQLPHPPRPGRRLSDWNSLRGAPGPKRLLDPDYQRPLPRKKKPKKFWKASIENFTGVVRSLCWHPKTSRIAGSGEDGLVKIWDHKPNAPDNSSWELVKTLEGHTDVIVDIKFAPDASKMATASADGTVKVWNVAGDDPLNWKEDITLDAHKGMAYKVAFSPDSMKLASSGEDSCAHIWNVSSKSPSDWTKIKTYIGSRTRIFGLALSPDNRMVVTGGEDRVAKVWPLQSNFTKEMYRLGRHTDSIYDLAFSPDSGLVASANKDGTVKVYDVGARIATKKGVLIKSFPHQSGRVLSLDFSSDGSRLAIGCRDFSASVIDMRGKRPKDWRIFKRYCGHHTWVRRVMFSPDGTQLALACENTIKILDAPVRKKAPGIESSEEEEDYEEINFKRKIGEGGEGGKEVLGRFVQSNTTGVFPSSKAHEELAEQRQLPAISIPFVALIGLLAGGAVIIGVLRSHRKTPTAMQGLLLGADAK